jgi:uncharacterized protein YukE
LLQTSADIRAEAHTVRRHAQDLRDTALRLTSAAAGTRWHSTAADAYRNRVRRLAHDVQTCADHLDAAARALDRHAARVGRVVGTAEHLAGAGLSLARDGWHAASGVLHAVGL